MDEPPNRPDDLTNDKHFVMVHGYNVNEDAARGWGAEMFKRLYHLGSNAKFTMVTWQGNTYTPNDYWENVTNAFITAEHLKNAVGALPGTKIIAAHSLGNMVVSSAIVDHGMTVEKYFMLDAAVPIEAYDASVSNIDTMRHPDWERYNTEELRPYWSCFWHERFEEDNDGRRGLTWKSRFGPIANAINYYSSGEEVLENGDGSGPPNAVWSLAAHWWNGYGVFGGAQLAWYRQEVGKGRGDTFLAVHPAVIADLQGGWGFNSHWNPNNAGIVSRLSPDEVRQIPLEATKQHPFFYPFQITGLTDPNTGSSLASSFWPRAKTLAEGIPSMSNAAGSNPIPAFTDRNVDLMALRDGWPEERPEMSANDSRKRWLHSDAKDVAFRYNYKLFQDWIDNGILDEAP